MKKELLIKILALSIVILFISSGVAVAFNINLIDNNPPYEPSNPHPPNGSINVPTYVVLCWTGGDPDPGDNITYDVYLGDNLVSNNQTETCYEPIELELNKTYFWRIVAWDNNGASTSGPTWSFTTGINHPPGAPKINGPSDKPITKNLFVSKLLQIPLPKPGTHNFRFNATDPDSDDVYYYIDWGDGTTSGWIGPFPSGEEITCNHTWLKKGKYLVRAKAKDIYDQESPWGEMDIPIQRISRLAFNSPFIEILKQRMLFVYVFSLFNPINNGYNVINHQSIENENNTLYVGGSGPNNYTKIQDAIDNASDGDTVFVYDDSSPYIENIVINTSISLFGEDKNTTVIDGSSDINGINITIDNVTIIGFTIQNCSKGAAICLFSNYNRITDNIISNNMIGIETYYNPFDPPGILSDGYNTITNNLIIYNEGLGIGLSGKNNTVKGNIISQTQYGIILAIAVTNNISNNIISENENGIFILGSYNNVIYRNNISHNQNLGISIFGTSSDIILQNNFIGNGQNAYFNQPLLVRLRILKKLLNLPIRHSIWDGNFWDRPRLMPYKIPGLISLIRGPDIEAPYNFNIFQFDWHPAKKPYDIPNEV